jgi:inner membrane protein
MITAAASLFLLWRLHQYYWKKDLERPVIQYRQWYWLFFLTFATHILLDCCTAYGTQVFQPFSNARIAFDNIAVADPFYTIPFLICVVIMAFMKRNTRSRTMVNWLGIGISCAYLLFTVKNKIYVDHVFEKALAHRHIEPTRTRATATILNNILWACVAEDKEHYYIAQYSLLDSDPNLHYVSVLPKHDSIRTMLAEEADYKKLLWFSNGYLAEFPTDTGIFLSDIRYGGFGDTVTTHSDMFMNFKVVKEDGHWKFSEYREPFKGTFGEAFRRLWRRIKGY